MTRREVSLLKEGTIVVPLIGPRRDETGVVTKVEMDAGAYNGWVTVLFLDGSTALFAGEELVRAYTEELGN